MTTIIIVAVVLVVIAAIALVFIGLRDSSGADPLQDRLADYAARGETATLEQIELSQPISERIIYPVARKLGEIALRFTPQNALQSTQRKIELAGSPRGLDPTLLWAMRFIAAVVVGGLMVFMMSIGLKIGVGAQRSW